jgi:hypothetical protein
MRICSLIILVCRRLSSLPFVFALSVVACAEAFSDEISSPLLRSVSVGGTYRARLVNGDVITGKVLQVVSRSQLSKELEQEQPSGKEQPSQASGVGEAVRLETSLGIVIILAEELVELTPLERWYRHNHRLYIMPTAEPIGGNAFIGLWELLFIYGGVGITDYVSLTVGRSVIPFIFPHEQAALANLKITPFRAVIDESGSQLFTCLGANLALLNDANPFVHIFAGATFKGARTSFTGHIFYKANEPGLYEIRAGNEPAFSTVYSRGTIGLGLGLDSRFSDRHDVRFIAELWNADVLRPSNSALLLGLRLANTAISMDFGVALVARPLAIPFVSFAWTPF